MVVVAQDLEVHLEALLGAHLEMCIIDVGIDMEAAPYQVLGQL